MLNTCGCSQWQLGIRKSSAPRAPAMGSSFKTDNKMEERKKNEIVCFLVLCLHQPEPLAWTARPGSRWQSRQRRRRRRARGRWKTWAGWDWVGVVLKIRYGVVLLKGRTNKTWGGLKRYGLWLNKRSPFIRLQFVVPVMEVIFKVHLQQIFVSDL